MKLSSGFWHCPFSILGGTCFAPGPQLGLRPTPRNLTPLHEALDPLVYLLTCLFSDPTLQKGKQVAFYMHLTSAQSGLELPEWGAGIWQICLCAKVVRIAQYKSGNR